MTPKETPEIVAKEISDEAGVYEISVTYASNRSSDSHAANAPSPILRTTPKVFAFQTQTPRSGDN